MTQMYDSFHSAVEDGLSLASSYLDGLAEGEAPNAEVMRSLLKNGITRATDILDGCYGES